MSNKTFAIRPFEKLRKKIAATQNAPAPLPHHPKKKEEYSAEELFNCEMNDVQEILEFRSLVCPHRQRKSAKSKTPHCDPDRESLDILAEIASGHRPINLPDTQEYVEWVNPDHHDSVIPKLHEGQFAVQAFLDLHGCTVPEAEDELDQFMIDSFRKGLRCVKIIHGRGLRSIKGPRIKDAVIRRLSGHFRKDILAFVTARQCDGGLGALYILLRKK
ncbi:MAG TPA: Smr/MutS family protein [Nitrospirota bacterium]|nr:Smr/MutS family protein [Nitrospirota bacterium]